jgi:DNA-directed RNA polymerase sigma subunit (sigma70/sigma32)
MDRKELKEDVKIEIENLGRLNNEMKALLAKTEKEPTFMEIRAAANILHDFYSGVERIFERIAVSIDKHMPKGENWHIELLLQMAKPFGNIRGPVISENLFEKLQEYLKFCHLFRHMYGFELK